MTVLLIIGGLFLFAYVVHMFMCGLFVPMLALIVLLVLGFVVPRVAMNIREKRAQHPKLTAKQISLLAIERQKDAEAKAENDVARAEAQDKYTRALATRAIEINERINDCIKTLSKDAAKLKKEFAALEKMDCVGEDEKNLQIVDLLIHFIKTRRADNIKEALHEYDKLVANQQLLQIETEKLEVARQKAIQEHQDRVQQMEMQRQHNWEMEFSARRAADENRRIADQLDYIGYLVHTDVNYNRG